MPMNQAQMSMMMSPKELKEKLHRSNKKVTQSKIIIGYSQNNSQNRNYLNNNYSNNNYTPRNNQQPERNYNNQQTSNQQNRDYHSQQEYSKPSRSFNNQQNYQKYQQNINNSQTYQRTNQNYNYSNQTLPSQNPNTGQRAANRTQIKQENTIIGQTNQATSLNQ